MIWRTVRAVGGLLAGVLVLALVVGAVLGQPVGLGYVETGSMAPTLAPGDGFVAVPPSLAGSVGVGDVVVFRAQEIEGGGLTTHRIVGETDRGFITQGDANSFTDQGDGEPPVKRAQVVAVALQVRGEVVRIPALGSVVTGVQEGIGVVQRTAARALGTSLLLGTQGLAYLGLAVSLLLYAFDVWRERTARGETRDRSRGSGVDGRLVVGVFVLVLVAAMTVAMVGPGGTQSYDIVSAGFESDRPRVIPTGGTETATYPVANTGVIPVVAFLEPGSEGVSIEPRSLSVGADTVGNATVTLQAPPETGAYRRYVVEHRYLALLPTDHVRALYEVNPWLPVLVIDGAVALPLYVVGLRLVGTGRVRVREREVPLGTAVRRSLRRLYR